MARRAGVALGIVGAIACTRAAAADPNDLVMARLSTPVTDTMGVRTGTIGDNLDFRALASQLGVVLAPHLLTPADTLGFAGFQFDVEGSMTSIDAKAPYWRARQGSPNPTGDNGMANGPGSLRTLGFFVKKGLWFPVPSFEVGAGAVHLVDSSTWTGQLYAKVGLHEGYHELPLPSLAVRGAVSRMMTQRELDLTVASLDVTISKHLGVGGTWRLDPFAGWDLLMIIPRSEVIDPTPQVDPLAPGSQSDSQLNFVFKDQATIYRQRILVGAKFQYSVVQLTFEAQFALKGSSSDDRAGTDAACTANPTTANCDSKDTAAAQQTYSISAGIDF